MTIIIFSSVKAILSICTRCTFEAFPKLCLRWLFISILFESLVDSCKDFISLYFMNGLLQRVVGRKQCGLCHICAPL